ncbi:MAG: hypothetical protein QXJ83_00485, partial [Sulfolobales archaeon]
MSLASSFSNTSSLTLRLLFLIMLPIAEVIPNSLHVIPLTLVAYMNRTHLTSSLTSNPNYNPTQYVIDP